MRDLLKGTLAFRGSTMETECDFMEIDNNIAARLQIPSLQQQKDGSELSETLPVPMLANFGHFEDSDEKESSFMTGDVEGAQHGETADSDEPAASLTKSVATHENTLSSQEQTVEDSENSLDKQDIDGEDSSHNLSDQDCGNAVDTEDLLSSFIDEHKTIHSIGSIPLFCGENRVAGTEERRSSDNSISTNDSILSGLDPRSENEISVPESKLDQKSFQDKTETVSVTLGDEPLFSEPLAEASYPPSETENKNTETRQTDSPDREFVFVNRDGTAQASPTSHRHPLEENDELFY